MAPERLMSGYVGGGIAHTTFGNLDDQFGTDIEATIAPRWSAVATAGVRYRVSPSLFLEVSGTYLPLKGDIDVRTGNDPRVVLPAEVKLDPKLVSFGAVWRF
jgi:outer membrane protein W